MGLKMKDRIKECTDLAEEILKSFELSELPIQNILLMCLRLCRLLNDAEGVLLFTFETAGYEVNEDGYMSADAWRISKLAGHRYFKKGKDGKSTEYANTEMLSVLETNKEVCFERMKIATDPDVSISSSNPNQYVWPNTNSNIQERSALANQVIDSTRNINKIKSNLYNYIMVIRNNLVYGNTVESVFDRYRELCDKKLKDVCAESIKKFMSIYENLNSNNEEDWANAVHSCRRILKDLADKLYPPCEDIVVDGKTIKLGNEQYINRLIQYIEKNSSSKAYKKIVGSSLASIGERIDAIYNSSNKGTHAQISKLEAERYIIYTYMLVGDILMIGD